MPAVLECIGKEGDSAERMRNKRKKEKMSQCDALVTGSDDTVRMSDTEQEIEKEIEQEQEENDNYVVVDSVDKYLKLLNKKLSLNGLSEINLTKGNFEFINSLFKLDIDFSILAMRLVDIQRQTKINDAMAYFLADPGRLKSIMSGEELKKLHPFQRSTRPTTTEYELYVSSEDIERINARTQN